jgi:broad specificity phosphatase PhoE
MVTIIFESHSTTTDNEAHLSSGHNDVELSKIGKAQAKELGERYKGDHFAAVFCSDLQRSYETGEIAFRDQDWPIVRDARLRECDYGDLTQHPSSEVDPEKPKHVTVPFPNGESYEDTAKRMGEFLRDIKTEYDGRKIMIIGHRATQYGLEHWINGLSVKDSVTAPWKWQPGWKYELV